ncbi:High-affinity branched-chain amino acid transport ATP-binding protein LivF [wastewater metagenome]|uniref:High-affinity branched-chain amino acid transport ATP-binding protein LivF n=2 Tax=unclassified sequences TaxID=12908 RepID=A0A5B8RC66_9ZZZZ|nr:urea ABC transporter ATP-binding subunit UrtE [Arhodomonas sp. KWT]QEA05064.1 high-affinity branched-chain amino acid transport ATP-binding protein LivF [uncultured organism]
MLEAQALYSYYGKSPIVQDVSFTVPEGSFVSVLGRNGVGKTTLLRTVMGLTDGISGRLSFRGEDLSRLPTHERARRGIGYIPQGREVIPRFSVRENIVMGTYTRRDGRRDLPGHILELFPVLREFLDRRGGDLSGGQQQQLAIARALAMDPRVLLLDEPTEGIQPNIVHEIEQVLLRLNREFGITVVLVDQNIPFARRASDHFIVLDKGRVAVAGHGEELTDEVAERYLTF